MDTCRVITASDIQLLTKASFAAFGDVIEAVPDSEFISINYGHTQRFHDLATIDTMSNDGNAIVNIFRSTPLTFPMALTVMERHPLGSQLFFPLSDEPYLVIVAPAGEFNQQRLKIFLASHGRHRQGVNYAKGTWHHFCLALNTTSDFLVIDRAGSGNNCDEQSLNPALSIAADTVSSILALTDKNEKEAT
ncbi:ureidoglycolate lyase [Flocculibacter collagenilyticus]|uniref:ureidoglycolate lyase n=1 Tax=Flocculibacter collagenilyticus TaxID=2744479 RepID=UPI0018F3ED20|nr:ureidoglycolate lyase [Flocculibacter collagenilyticus]